MTYIVSYDLNKPGKNYQDLYDAIKQLGPWVHPLDSTWLVKSDLSATEVRNELLAVMDSSDALLVAKASAPAAWHGFSDEINQWLKDNL